MVQIHNKVYGMMKPEHFTGSLTLETIQEVLVDSLGVGLTSSSFSTTSYAKCTPRNSAKRTRSSSGI